MALCGDNRGPWRFFFKVLNYCTSYHLVLEQWTKKWMNVSSSKLQNKQSEVLSLQNKKGFWLWYRVLCKILYWKHHNLESIVVISGRV